MDTLISWTLAAVGYFGAVALVLWFTQRVEAGLGFAPGDGRRVIGDEPRQSSRRGRNAAGR